MKNASFLSRFHLHKQFQTPILVVFTILSVLYLAYSVRESRALAAAEIAYTQDHITILRLSAKLYKYAHGEDPETLNELVTKDVNSSLGPFLIIEDQDISPIKDAWGNDYRYAVYADRVCIASLGPDGKLGNNDDLTGGSP